MISPEPPSECPKCRAESPCVDYNEVDIGVGYQRFDHSYQCPTHGEFGFGPQTGEPIFREGEPAA